jgi:hypothetical protein
MIAAGLDVELLAHARKDGRWEAHVASVRNPAPRTQPVAVTTARLLVPWPSVNGPTALVALDALEAELREMIHDTLSEPPVSPIREMIGEA